MSAWIVLFSTLAYLGLLFAIAYLSERSGKKGKSWVKNPYVYALSMAIYCTAWTFYGSVGRAATGGVQFLGVFLGPTLMAPLWMKGLKKIIVISQSQRINSIADFISARYGKGAFLGGLVTLIAIFSIIPYIALQLRGCLDFSFTAQNLSFSPLSASVFLKILPMLPLCGIHDRDLRLAYFLKNFLVRVKKSCV